MALLSQFIPPLRNPLFSSLQILTSPRRTPAKTYRPAAGPPATTAGISFPATINFSSSDHFALQFLLISNPTPSPTDAHYLKLTWQVPADMASHVTRKRKDPEPSSSRANDSAPVAKPTAPPPAGDSRLLAGYLAHEFLTRGTMLGRRWEPSRAIAGKVASRAENGKGSSRAEPNQSELKAAKPYAEVSALLMKTDGAHIPGVVNPTQLGQWLLQR